MKTTLTLAWLDLRNIYRESMLLIIAMVPLFVTLLMRFGIPPLTTWSLEKGFDLSPHVGFIHAYLLLFPGMMLGMAAGYVLLDERDEQVLAWFSVTPLGKNGYLKYRLLSPVVLSVAYALALPLILGLGIGTALVLIPAAFLGGLQVMFFILAMGAFAGNKVEGLALAKFLSVIYVLPVAAYILGEPWKWVFLLVPSVSVTETALAAKGGEWGMVALYLPLGMLVLAGWLFLLKKRFVKRMG